MNERTFGENNKDAERTGQKRSGPDLSVKGTIYLTAPENEREHIEKGRKLQQEADIEIDRIAEILDIDISKLGLALWAKPDLGNKEGALPNKVLISDIVQNPFKTIEKNAPPDADPDWVERYHLKSRSFLTELVKENPTNFKLIEEDNGIGQFETNVYYVPNAEDTENN